METKLLRKAMTPGEISTPQPVMSDSQTQKALSWGPAHFLHSNTGHGWAAGEGHRDRVLGDVFFTLPKASTQARPALNHSQISTCAVGQSLRTVA